MQMSFIAELPLSPNADSPLCHFDQWLDDEKASTRSWSDDAARLFSEAEEVRINVIDVGKEYQIFRDEERFGKALVRDHQKIRIILVPQEFSWGCLLISESCMKVLLNYLRAFPALLGNLHTFGQRTDASNESRGGYTKQHDSVAGTDERCYLLKCVERHGREGLDDPWSIRQFAIYERHGISDDLSDFLVVNPSASRMLREKLFLLQKTHYGTPSRTTLHLMMISACVTNWTSYVDWLESQLYPLTSKAYIASSPVNSSPEAIARVPINMGDMQNLQIIQDKLHRANHLLEVNENAAGALANDLFLKGGGATDGIRSMEVDRIQAHLNTFRMEGKRLRTLIGRAASVSGLMQNIMSTGALETLHDSSSTSTRIAKLAQEDNKIMLTLSEEGRRDGRTLKTITVLTLAYLPASFVSTLLSMGYITIQGNSVDFKPEMIVFLVLTVILLVITFSLWYAWDLRQGRRKAGRRYRQKSDWEKTGAKDDPCHIIGTSGPATGMSEMKKNQLRGGDSGACWCWCQRRHIR